MVFFLVLINLFPSLKAQAQLHRKYDIAMTDCMSDLADRYAQPIGYTRIHFKIDAPSKSIRVVTKKKVYIIPLEKNYDPDFMNELWHVGYQINNYCLLSYPMERQTGLAVMFYSFAIVDLDQRHILDRLYSKDKQFPVQSMVDDPRLFYMNENDGMLHLIIMERVELHCQENCQFEVKELRCTKKGIEKLHTWYLSCH